jgi:acyl carrier protein phosphodiesterase
LNYLAHAYLSFGQAEILVGNMISDHVKGKTKFDFPPLIQLGIALHRSIDQFTDLHPATREAKEIFRPHYRLYSGAVVDVIYDHFLANDANEFDERKLLAFSGDTYETLMKYARWFPEKFALMFPYMRSQNWLYHYRRREGTAKSLQGLVRRSKYLTESETAFRLFTSHYQLLGDLYRQFWQDIRPFAEKELEILSNQ